MEKSAKEKPEVTKVLPGGIVCFNAIVPKVPGLKLNIGSGDGLQEGYINVDKYNPHAEAPWDAGHLPLNDSTVAVILCIQTMEHFSRPELVPIVNEWFRVLKPGGEVYIATPDIVACCADVVKDPDSEWLLARIFGNQTHGGQFHKWGFTPQQLYDLFGFAGFTSTELAYIMIGNQKFIYVKATR